MNVYTIWKQYPQSYPGELMPNIGDCIDEYANEDNPSWLEGKIEEAKQEVAKGDIDAYRVIVLRFDDDIVTDAFTDVRASVKAKVLDDNGSI